MAHIVSCLFVDQLVTFLGEKLKFYSPDDSTQFAHLQLQAR